MANAKSEYVHLFFLNRSPLSGFKCPLYISFVSYKTAAASQSQSRIIVVIHLLLFNVNLCHLDLLKDISTL